MPSRHADREPVLDSFSERDFANWTGLAIRETQRDILAWLRDTPGPGLRIVQAPTGVGKTHVSVFVMMDAVRRGKRGSLVSCTCALQQQLYAAFPLDWRSKGRVAIVFGRRRYLCRKLVAAELATGASPSLCAFLEQVLARPYAQPARQTESPVDRFLEHAAAHGVPEQLAEQLAGQFSGCGCLRKLAPRKKQVVELCTRIEALDKALATDVARELAGVGPDRGAIGRARALVGGDFEWLRDAGRGWLAPGCAHAASFLAVDEDLARFAATRPDVLVLNMHLAACYLKLEKLRPRLGDVVVIDEAHMLRDTMPEVLDPPPQPVSVSKLQAAQEALGIHPVRNDALLSLGLFLAPPRDPRVKTACLLHNTQMPPELTALVHSLAELDAHAVERLERAEKAAQRVKAKVAALAAAAAGALLDGAPCAAEQGFEATLALMVGQSGDDVDARRARGHALCHLARRLGHQNEEEDGASEGGRAGEEDEAADAATR